MRNDRDDGETAGGPRRHRWEGVGGSPKVSFGFSADAETPIVQQPTNASEKTQLITDGRRRYADTYT